MISNSESLNVKYNLDNNIANTLSSVAKYDIQIIVVAKADSFIQNIDAIRLVNVEKLVRTQIVKHMLLILTLREFDLNCFNDLFSNKMTMRSVTADGMKPIRKMPLDRQDSDVSFANFQPQTSFSRF